MTQHLLRGPRGGCEGPAPRGSPCTSLFLVWRSSVVVGERALRDSSPFPCAELCFMTQNILAKAVGALNRDAGFMSGGKWSINTDEGRRL